MQEAPRGASTADGAGLDIDFMRLAIDQAMKSKQVVNMEPIWKKLNR